MPPATLPAMASPPKGAKPDTHARKPAAKKKAAGAAAPDWERIELDYRAGVKSLRQIAEGHGITEGAIRKRAKRDDWARDLSERIQERAEQLVRKEAVRTAVRTETATERQVVDANAQAVADVRLAHRRDIHRKRAIVARLMDELERQIGPEAAAMLEELGEMMRSPDDAGQDKLNDLYRKIISLPERAKTAKTLAETLRITVDMERQAFGMDVKTPAGDGAQSTRDMTDAERAVRVAAVLNGGGAPALLEALRASRSGA